MSSTRVWQLDYCISFLETLLIQLVRNTQEDKTIHVFYSPGTSRKLEGYHCLVVIVEIIQRDLGENCLLCTHEVCREFVQVFFARISSLSTQNAFVQHNNDLIPNLVDGLCAYLLV